MLILRLKEICHEAGVNRSTFYLHYETLDDLLKESVEYMNRHFLEHMGQDSRNFVNKINDCSKDGTLSNYTQIFKTLFKLY